MTAELPGFDFSIKEYIADKDEVLKRATNHFHKKSVIGESVQSYIQCVFIQKVKDSIKWSPIPSPLSDGDRISCRLNSYYFSGIVNFAPKNMIIRMIKDNMCFSLTDNIPDEVPASYTSMPFQGSEGSDFAIIRAKELIIGCIVSYFSLPLTIDL